MADIVTRPPVPDYKRLPRTPRTPYTPQYPTTNYPGTGTSSDPFGGLEGADRDAAVAIQKLFESYGLGTLAPKIVEFIRLGYSSDTIILLLQETSEYKQRFAANETRKARGLPMLTPAEYLAAESAYRQIMVAAGLPAGFYDNPNDFQSFLERDISPQEVQGRVSAARDFIDRADPYELAAMKKFYTTGDLIAFALDPNRAAPLVGKAFNAAAVAGQASEQGISIGQSEAESLAGLGVDSANARQGFSLIAGEKDNAAKLAAIDGTSLTVNDLIDETFRQDAAVAARRAKLGSAEQGRFGGSSGVVQGSLSTGKGL